MRFVATLLLTTPFLVACAGDTPKTQAELIIGEWEQVEPTTMTEQGMTVVFTDGEVEYKADGTAESETTLTFEAMPEGLKSYDMDVTSTYTLIDGYLTDQVTGGTVTPVTAGPEADAFAAQMQAAMPQTPESRSEIMTLTDDRLVIREVTTGTILTYKRD